MNSCESNTFHLNAFIVLNRTVRKTRKSKITKHQGLSGNANFRKRNAAVSSDKKGNHNNYYNRFYFNYYLYVVTHTIEKGKRLI